MVRILFIVAWFAASIYAISDWATTPADRMPMKLSRMTWLVILVVTVPFVSLGAIAWIVLKMVANAEDRQAQSAPKTPTAPDELALELGFRHSGDHIRCLGQQVRSRLVIGHSNQHVIVKNERGQRSKGTLP